MSRDLHAEIADKVRIVGPRMAREFKACKTEKRTIGYLRLLGFSKHMDLNAALQGLMAERFEYDDKEGVFAIGLERVEFPEDHNFRKIGISCAYRLKKEIIVPRINQRPVIEQTDPTPMSAPPYSP